MNWNVIKPLSRSLWSKSFNNSRHSWEYTTSSSQCMRNGCGSVTFHCFHPWFSPGFFSNLTTWQRQSSLTEIIFCSQIEWIRKKEKKSVWGIVTTIQSIELSKMFENLGHFWHCPFSFFASKHIDINEMVPSKNDQNFQPVLVTGKGLKRELADVFLLQSRCFRLILRSATSHTVAWFLPVLEQFSLAKIYRSCPGHVLHVN